MEGRYADAVIVAAGASRRMEGTDKLEVELLGRPLLAWAVEAMAQAKSVRRLVVVAAADRVEALARSGWLRAAAAERPLEVVAGGAERIDSVEAGVHSSDAELVIVHDGARPLASSALADAVAAAAAREGAAIPVLAVAESLKKVVGDRVDGAVAREGVAAAQTPQGARRELLIGAFERVSRSPELTDEAALLAAAGVGVATVEGEPANLKVTRPADLELARALLAARLGGTESSTGFGQDSHPFGPADGLWLGGLLIEDAPRLHGHSDGDVALHALATAFLAAARLGDLGRHFPPTDTATAGASSAGLLSSVVEQVRGAGWRPVSAQVSLLGARPRLGAQRLEAIRLRMAELAGVESGQMAVVASSANLAGPEGAGLAISASAFVSLVRR